ncbi:MAG: PilZ domain-containing protein [Candidatus Omnitrophica bacterium]|nr:PilZ domain-containing protein [Candidatus Omnitrophota bacterium]
MLEINFKRVGAIAVLDLAGTIDLDSSNFIETVGWCLENGYTDILCNFESVNLVDYSGLSVLAISYRNVLNHKGRLKLVFVPPHIRKIFTMVCMDRVFEIYDDENFALRSFEEDKVISEIKKKQLRRRFKRLFLDINIEFRPLGSKSEFIKGKILNISAVGILIFAGKQFPLGELLDLRLDLSPQPGHLEIEGKVVWHVQKEIQPHIYPGMGVEFYHLTGLTQQKILEFVERNLPLGMCGESD